MTDPTRELRLCLVAMMAEARLEPSPRKAAGSAPTTEDNGALSPTGRMNSLANSPG